MDATSFELRVSLPAEPRYAETMKELATHAARYAGCAGPAAESYGGVVESVALGCIARSNAGSFVSAVVRRGSGPVEVLIGCEQRFETAGTSDSHITIGWTRDADGQMCRVSRSMPVDT